MMVRVEGTPFVRDTTTMGLSNTDQTARNEYYAKVRMLTVQKEEINKVNDEINSLKTEMQDIKGLLLQLLNKGSNG